MYLTTYPPLGKGTPPGTGSARLVHEIEEGCAGRRPRQSGRARRWPLIFDSIGAKRREAQASTSLAAGRERAVGMKTLKVTINYTLNKQPSIITRSLSKRLDESEMIDREQKGKLIVAAEEVVTALAVWEFGEGTQVHIQNIRFQVLTEV